MIAKIRMNPRCPGPLRPDDEKARKAREIYRPSRHTDITKPVANFVFETSHGDQSEVESVQARALRARRRLVIS